MVLCRRAPRMAALAPWAAALVVLMGLAGVEAAAAQAPDSLIYTKDIFDPQRGAQAQGGGGGLEEQQLLKELHVLGVVIVKGRRRAFIRRLHPSNKGKGQEVVGVGQGDSLAGWTVASIGEKEVVLEKAGRRVTLPVFQAQGGERRPVGLATPRLPAPRGTNPPAGRGRTVRPPQGRVLTPQAGRNPLLMKLLQRLREQEKRKAR